MAYILSMYSQLVLPPVIQNVRTYGYDNNEQEKLRNRVTVDELPREVPHNKTNVRFTVVATILEILGGRPWYFIRRHDCRHKIFNERPHVYCEPRKPDQPKDYSYCFRMLISDQTGTLTLTCFSDLTFDGHRM